jgi:protein SCO1/2
MESKFTKTTVAGCPFAVARIGGRLATLIGLLVLISNGAAVAQHKHGSNHGPAKPTAAQPSTTSLIPDLTVIDQNGEPRKFYSDLVKGRVVIINFIYTTCTAICPMSGKNFSRLQTLLGDRLGRDVFLISVTTDPVIDSPAKLKDWSERYNAKPGWTLVTGEKNEMTNLLRALTGDGPIKGYHVTSLAIVNDIKGNQRRVYGLEAPEQVLKLTDELRQMPVSEHHTTGPNTKLNEQSQPNRP